MILAHGVKKCRFCSHELDPGFFGDAGLRAAIEAEAEAAPTPEVGFNEALRSAQFTPVPPKFPEATVSGGSDAPVAPRSLGPPTNLSQGRREASQATRVTSAPGSSVASRALEEELERVTRGESAPLKVLADSVVGSAPVSLPALRSSAQIEAFDSRQLKWAGSVFAAAVISAVLWFMSSGQPSSHPARKCGVECQERFDAQSSQADHTSFISRCVSECMRPEP